MADLSPLIAFSAGIVSVLSPCVLPLIPAVMAYSTGKGRLRPLAIVLGLSLSFTSMGIAASILGMAFIGYVYHLRIAAALIIIFLGLYMLSESLERKLLTLKSRMLPSLNLPISSSGVVGGFILGLSLGIAWTPCIGPILGTILALVAIEASPFYGAVMLFIYSLGLGIPMLVIGYVTKSSIQLGKFARYGAILKRVTGAVLIIVGLYMMLDLSPTIF